jgi:hypothetical protein
MIAATYAGLNSKIPAWRSWIGVTSVGKAERLGSLEFLAFDGTRLPSTTGHDPDVAVVH